MKEAQRQYSYLQARNIIVCITIVTTFIVIGVTKFKVPVLEWGFLMEFLISIFFFSNLIFFSIQFTNSSAGIKEKEKFPLHYKIKNYLDKWPFAVGKLIVLPINCYTIKMISTFGLNRPYNPSTFLAILALISAIIVLSLVMTFATNITSKHEENTINRLANHFLAESGKKELLKLAKETKSPIKIDSEIIVTDSEAMISNYGKVKQGNSWNKFLRVIQIVSAIVGLIVSIIQLIVWII